MEPIESNVNTKNETMKKAIPDDNLNKLNDEELFNKIFNFSEKEISSINQDSANEIILLFNMHNFSDNTEGYFLFIEGKIKIMKKIIELINNSFELLNIINKSLEKNTNKSLIIFFIDLYFNTISLKNYPSELIKEILTIINILIGCGLINKKDVDYIYQKLSLQQLNQNLTLNGFYDYLPLLEIIYGNNLCDQYKNKLIAKSYMHFYDKENSGILTNINEINKIPIHSGCSFILWFYLIDINVKESILCEFETESNGRKNTFKIILSETSDIYIKYNENKLSEDKNKIYEIKKNTWIQLKIQFSKNNLKLNVFHFDKKEKNNNLNSRTSGEIIKEKYDTKTYITKKNLPDFNIKDFNITKISFFKKYKGIISTIIFCNNNNPSEIPIDSEYGLKNNKIANFMAEIGLSDIYFIFSPSLYLYENNKFIDSSNNVSGTIIKHNENNYLEINDVYQYNNTNNNIYKLGGVLNILPLFEILYKFTCNNEYCSEKDEILIHKIFIKLMEIMEIIFINKQKNYLNSLKIPVYSSKNNFTFFDSLQLFFELIPEKYYRKDDKILKSSINIGKFVYKLSKLKNISNDDINIYEFFKKILFNPKLIMKYNLKEQNTLWNFFEEIKNNKKDSVQLFDYSDYRKCFMSFDNINKLLVLLSKKYADISPPQPLFNIIRKIFEDNATNDKERENLLLLYDNSKPENNTICKKFLINIIEIFIYYLDITKNSISLKYNKKNDDKINFFGEEELKKSIINSRLNSINAFLYSNNYFLENLLNILSESDADIKKVVLNLLRIVSQKYNDELKKYFSFVDNESRKDKKNKKLNDENAMKRINKEDFYYFIGENIIPNNRNKIISESILLKFKESKNQKKKRNSKLRKISAEDSQYNNQILCDFKEKNIINNNNSKNISESKNNEDLLSFKKCFSSKNKKIKKNFDLNISNDEKNHNASVDNIKNLASHCNNFIIDKNMNCSIKKEEKSKNENNINNEIENKKINCEISMILFDWLLSMDDNKNINTLLKEPLNKNNNFVIINISSPNDNDSVINFIIKLITASKELELIYKILIIIVNQKSIDIDSNTNNTSNYYRLLNYFSYSKTQIIQLIEELMINSYLCLYDDLSKKKFSVIEEISMTRLGTKDKNELFNIIYKKSKELLIDIYFHENDNQKNDIIYEVINIILKLYGGLNKNNTEDQKLKNILLGFTEKFLVEVRDVYHKKLENIIKQKDINNKLRNIKNYICFIPFIFEYCLLINSSYDYISQKFIKIKNKKISDFPEFLLNTSNLNPIPNNSFIKDLYFKIFRDIKLIFNFDSIINNVDYLKKQKEEIINIKTGDINHLVNEFIFNKEKRNKLKYNLELLLLTNNEGGYNKKFPLIEVITLFNNYIIETSGSTNDFEFLNGYQFFVIYIIVLSCSIKENDTYSLVDVTFKEIQDILYNNLEFYIGVILNKIEIKNGTFRVIFNNILRLISIIWVVNYDKTPLNKKSTYFDISKSAVYKLMTNYITKCTSFFNSTNIVRFSRESKDNIEKMIKENTEEIVNKLIARENEEIINNPTTELFDLIKYENIYNLRSQDIKKLKLLINDNNENDSGTEGDRYKKLFIKIKKLKSVLDFNDLSEIFNNALKKNAYRKIKSNLYSWNNSYSNISAFYSKNNKIKYRISNFLSKDLTRKLLVPILDIKYYIPNFTKFNYENNIFEKNSDKSYSIDLSIFSDDNDTDNNIFNQNKYFIQNVCYVKTTHHIKGKLFFRNDIKETDDDLFMNNISFFPNKCELLSHEEQVKSNISYDSLHNTCFGSIFRNNINKRDKDLYFQINFNSINFIFIRKYCFYNNALEFYTSNHKSYYFIFNDKDKRNSFLEKLIHNLNKTSKNKNKLYQRIKSIDANNKTITIGYYKDEDNNKNMSTLINIRESWKLNKISTLEYLMWINIYGNRSFRDIAQYPIFPWLLTNYNADNFKSLILNNENIRDFRLPMGMLYIDDKSKKRRDGYIETYKSMVLDLNNENLVKLKVKDEDLMEEDFSFEPNENNNLDLKKRNSADNLIAVMNINNFQDNYVILKDNFNSVGDNNLNTNKNNNKKEISIIVHNYNEDNINNLPLSNEIILPKIPDYNFDIEKYYNNLNLDYEKIPYCFGSHFSNAMYVSHYLCRLFPYSLTMIEIQGSGFDCSERLFINLQRSFYSSISEKCDLREIIPEFFTIPELFLNINKLNLGEVEEEQENNSNENNIDENGNIILNVDVKKIKVEDVDLPKWCKNNPYIFIEKYRILFENSNLNINPWIDLIFGYSQRGLASQKIGNLYLPYVYDGVMENRIDQKDLITNREDNEYKMRLFEVGVNPTKVFDKKQKISKNKKYINLFKLSSDIDIIPDVRLKNNIKDLIYFRCNNTINEEIFIVDKKFILQKIIIQEIKGKETNKLTYIIKDNVKNNYELPLKKTIGKNIENEIILKQIFKGAFFLLAGYFDGSLYIMRNLSKNPLTKKDDLKIDNNISNQLLNNNIMIQSFDKSVITSLEIDREEKYIIYGTKNGSLVIYKIDHNLYKEGKKFISFIDIFQSHSGYKINNIFISSDLNLFADCAYDGYVNIYSLPNCKLIRSIFVDPNIYLIDYVFLSAQPLASIVLYSNNTFSFKCYSINGNEIKNIESDKKIKDDIKSENRGMESPFLFTDYQFNDYLIYILFGKYVIVRKFPSMEDILVINNSMHQNEILDKISISDDFKYLYIYEKTDNKIYIINSVGRFNSNKKDNK